MSGFAYGWLLIAALVVFGGVGAVWWLSRRRLYARLSQIGSRLDALVAAKGRSSPRRDGDALSVLATAVDQCAVLHQETEQRLEQEVTRRELAEARWRESEQRYALAVRGANDGMWEWDAASGNVQYSARWKAMLGYSESELGSRLEEWTERIHPGDRDHVLRELELHLQGRISRFEAEHRLQHRDGSWRVVLARATAVRHASGKVSRLVGLMTDISARKRVQEALVELADGLSSVQGEACFQELVRSFARVLGVREAFICECIDQPAVRVRMLARWKGDEFARCVEFDVAGTACEDVILNGTTVFSPREAGTRWPIERQYERDAYLGLPCFDSNGRVIGHIACADPGSMPEELPHQAILKIFAVRAGIELERRQLERERRAVGMRNSPGSWALH